MSDKQKTQGAQKPAAEAIKAEGELDQKQLDQAAGGMDVAGAVADLVIGGALPPKKKK